MLTPIDNHQQFKFLIETFLPATVDLSQSRLTLPQLWDLCREQYGDEAYNQIDGYTFFETDHQWTWSESDGRTCFHFKTDTIAVDFRLRMNGA